MQKQPGEREISYLSLASNNTKEGRYSKGCHMRKIERTHKEEIKLPGRQGEERFHLLRGEESNYTGNIAKERMLQKLGETNDEPNNVITLKKAHIHKDLTAGDKKGATNRRAPAKA